MKNHEHQTKNTNQNPFKSWYLGMLTSLLLITATLVSAAPMSGTYTINPSGSGPSNFTSFNSAISSLVSNGVNGAVTINVTTTSTPYNESLTINSIPNSSSTNTITFRGPDRGNASSPPASVSSSGTVLTFNGCAYVTFTSLSLNTTGSATYCVFLSNCTHCSLMSCNINANSSNSYAINDGNSISSTVSYCHISGGTAFSSGCSYGINVSGQGANTTYGYALYSNNRIVNFTNYGIWSYNTNQYSYIGNTIDSAINVCGWGWGSESENGATISNNMIFARSNNYAIVIESINTASSAKTFVFTNNFCANAITYYECWIGIYGGGGNVNIAHNTFYGTSTVVAAVNFYYNPSSETNLIFADNVCYSPGSGPAIYFQNAYGNINNTAFKMIDGNDYYSGGSTLAVLNGSSIPNISSLKSAMSAYSYTSPYSPFPSSKFDASATNIVPSIVSSTFPFNIHFNSGQTAIPGVNAGVTTDIFGVGRSASAPTAGAVENSAGELNFSGSSNYITLNSTLGNFGTGDFTIQENFKTTSSALMFIFSKRGDCNGGGNFIAIRLTNGKPEIETDDINANYTDLVSSTAYNDGNWHQVTAVRKNNFLTLYVDGTIVASGQSNANLGNGTVTTLGQSPCTSNMFTGDMDEVRIWSRALCAAEIANNKTCELASGQVGLLAYYNFDEGVPSGNNSATGGNVISLIDQTGNVNNNGTLVNFTRTGSSSNWLAGGLSGTCAAYTSGTMAVTGISNGGAAADFGSTGIGVGVPQTFTITNSGPNSLTFGTITFTGANASDFTVTSTPSTVSVNGSTTFTVTFNPSAAGSRSATINIPSNDCFNSPYTFSLSGTGLAPATGLNFNGTSDYVNINNSTSLNSMGSALTMEAWAYLTSNNGIRHIINKENDWEIASFSGALYYAIWTSSGSWFWISFNANIPLNTWTHVAVSYDGHNAYTYVNGNLTSTTPYTGTFNNNGQPLTIGWRGSRQEQIWAGNLDEIRVWSRSLCQGEIQATMNCELGVSQTNLAAYYKLNQGYINGNNSSAKIVTDASGNNNNSTDISATGFALSGATSNWAAGSTSVSGTCSAFSPTPITINTQPSSVTTCSGTSTSFTVSAGGPTITYQWQVNTGSGFTNITNGGIYSNATTVTLNLSGVTSTMNGYNYQCVLSTSCTSSVTTSSASLTVNTLPSISTSPSAASVNMGANATFSVSASGTNLNYQWQENPGAAWNDLNNGGIYSNVTTSTLNLTGVTSTMNNYQYRCVVSGSCSPAATSGSATLTVNPPAGALNFDGTNDYVLIPHQTNLVVSNALTMEAWVYPTNNSGWRQIINKEFDWEMWINNGVFKYAISTAGSNSWLEYDVASLPLNTWSHVAVTYDGTVTKGYVNGTLITSTPLTGTISNTGLPYEIGWRYSSGSGGPFAGSIDEVRVWNRSLCQAEIQNSLNCAFSGSQTGLISYFKFDQGFVNGTTGEPSTATDASGLNNNGTLTNFALSGANSNWAAGSTSVSGTCSAFINPTAALSSNSTSIPNGQVTATTSNNTDFGSTGFGTISKSFIINNTGNGPLTISSIVLNGPDASSFSIGSFSTSINASSSAPFNITFVNTTPGTYNATVTVNSNDCINPAYSFAIKALNNCVVPYISNSPASVAVNPGGNTFFTVAAGGSNLTYQWQENQGSGWNNLSNTGVYSTVTTAILNLTGVTSSMNTYQYRCVVSGSCPPVLTSGSAILTINAPAGALNFDGTDDDVNVATPFYAFNKEITVDWWVNPTTNMQLGSGIGQATNDVDNNATSNVWLMHFNGTGTSMNFYVNNGGNWITTGPVFPTANSWNHIVGVANASGIYLYMNGSLVSSASTGVTSTIFNNSNSIISLGRDVRYNNRFGNMSIDEVRIYNRALCASEIANNNGCELSGTVAGLQEYYKLNSGFVNGNNASPVLYNTAVDASGNTGRNGTLNGFSGQLTGSTANWITGIVSGTCTPFTNPTIGVTGVTNGGTAIAFSNSGVGVGTPQTFTVTNTGTALLNIGSISFSGTNPSDFAVTTAPASSVAVNGSTTFIVTFTPGAAGSRTAILSIASNDCNNNPFMFSISGTGLAPAGALDLTGSTDYVDLGAVLPSGTSYTKECWVYAVSTTCDNMISSVSDPFWFTGGHLSAGQNNNYSVVTDQGTFSTNTWTHVAISYDATTHTMNLYKNGSLVSTNSNAPAYGGGTIALGHHPISPSSGCFFQGQLDEVRIWNRALCQAEIQNNMSCQLPTNSNGIATGQTGLAAYYQMNQGFVNGNNNVNGSNTVTDNSGNGHTGSMNSFALSGSSSNWIAGHVSGSCATYTAPAIGITGNNTAINDGSLSTSGSNSTDFGQTTGADITETYTITNTGTASLTVSSIALSGANASNFSVSDITLPATIDINGSTTFTVTFSSSAVGIKNAVVTVNNSDCHHPAFAFAIKGELTCTSPVFTTCPSDITASTTSTTCDASVTYNPVVTGLPTPTLTYSFSGATTGSGSGTGSGLTFNKGVTTVTLTAANICNSNVTCSFTVTVNDNTLPTVNTQNISVNLDATGNASIIASQVDNGSSDACGILSMSVSPNNFTCANVGPNTVTLTVTDVNNNVNTNAATVTINDVTAPVVNTKNISVNLDATGNASIAASDVNNNSSDACGILSMSVSPNSFTCTNVGPNTVTLTVTDINNNVNTNTATVTINDVTAPVVNTKNISVNLDATGNASIAASDVNNSSTDACGILSMSVSPNSFTCTNVGPNTVTLTVTDVNNNVNTNTATVTINDVTAPVVNTKNISINLDATGNASIAASDVNNNSTDACGILSMSVSPNSFTCANVGPNTVTLTVTDVNNNVNTNTATVTINDVTAPIAIAQNVTVILDATGHGLTTAQLVNNGSNDACGIATMKLDKCKFDCSNVGKTNTVTLTVTDVNGNSSSATANVTVLDQTAPNTVVQNVTVVLDATGHGSITATQVDNNSTDACGIATRVLDNYNFDCSNVSKTNTVTLTCTDVNGNSSSGSANVTVLDQTAPVVNTQNITVNLDNTGNASIAASDVNNNSTDACGIKTMTVSPNTFTCANVGANTVTLTVTDVNGNVNANTATVTIKDVTAPIAIAQNVTVILDATGHGSTTAQLVNNGSNDACGIATLKLDNCKFDCSNVGKTNTVTLTVTDVNGNSSTATANVTVLDQTAPNTVAQNVTVVLDATGHGSITATQVDNNSTDACGIATRVLDNYNFDCSNVSKTNTVTLTCTDVNGNHSSAQAYVTVLDQTAPVVNTQNITVNLDNTGNASITASQVDNGSSDACGIKSESVSPNTFTCSNVGANTVTLTVTDVNGNVNTNTATVTIKDVTAPVVTTQNITVNLDATGHVSIIPAQVNNNSTDACGIKTMTVSPNTFSCANEGPNTVTLTATDVNGNINTNTATVTVIDKIAPTVLTKNVLITLNASNQASIAVSDIDNGSFDNCTIVSRVLSKTNFDCSNVNANTVTLTVTDNSGNVGTATAVVTVKDPIAPVARTKNITVYLDATGSYTITPANIDNGSSDNCSIVKMVLSKSTFTCADMGVNSITMTVYDAWGNSNAATATVTVIDNMAPVTRLKNITVYLDATGNVKVFPNQLDNGSTDNCAFIFAFDHDGDEWTNPNDDDLYKKYDCDDIGTHNVTVYTIDKSGNYSYGYATITVADNLAPVAIVKNITIYLDGNGSAKVDADDVNNGSTDNCHIASVSLSKTIFDCSNLGINYVTLTVKDRSGNAANATATITVKDNTPPTVVAKDVTVYLDASGNASITAKGVNGASYDNCSIKKIYLDDSTFTCADLGTTTVHLFAVDGSGNTGSDEVRVTVVDNIAPVARVKNATIYLDANGQASINANDMNNGSSDNCSVALSFRYDADDNHWDNSHDDIHSNKNAVGQYGCGDVGTHNVIIYAIDKSGNYSTASATITVVDNTAPVVKAQNISVTLNNNGSATIKPSDIDNGSYDNCSFILSLDKTSFSCANVGANTVTLKATDASGNISTATATVTVNTSLSVSLGADQTVYYGYAPLASATLSANVSGGSGKGYTYKWSNNATTQSITVSPTTGTQYTCTVTDANGCKVSDNAYVYVIDVRCTGGVMICHNGANLCTDATTAAAYLKKYKNDYLGACKQGKVKTTEGTVNGDGSLVAFPNPFTSTTTVRYNAENTENVSIVVYDVRGAKIQTLYEGPVTANTIYTYEIKGDNLPADVYFIRLTANDDVQYIKVVKTR